MIYPCDYQEFMNIVFSFYYNPVPVWTQVFVTKKEAMEKLSNIIADLTHLKPEVSSCDNSHCFKSPTGGLFEIYCKERYQFCCGKRAHNVIADSEYPLIDFYEIFMPMCNLGFGCTYSINSWDVIQYWDKAHEKGKEDIAYWKKVREEDANKKLN